MDHRLLLINPWIYDFAAYDLWSKPLGLLTLASFLRDRGFDVQIIDCMDVHHPEMTRIPTSSRPVRRAYGTGKFRRERIAAPSQLQHIPRPYSRYGISREALVHDLLKEPVPGAVLVTSLMTYWYPGVSEVIGLVKGIFPGTPIILGGIYAGLCREHAIQTSGADHVLTDKNGPLITALIELLEKYGIFPDERQKKQGGHSYPAFHRLRSRDYVCIAASTGCPFHCRYCASRFLNPHFRQRESGDILEEILFWNREYGIRDFAFYDDALLVNSDTCMGPVLEKLADLQLNLRFHTPNALHVREISPETARLLHMAGFRTIRLGLETSDMDLHHLLDRKVSGGEFEWAVTNLLKADFQRREIGAYILMGLPGQPAASVMESVEFVDASGAMPYLAEYSPIPHTSLWESACTHSEYDLASEPLFHNNTLMPCWDPAQREQVAKIRQRVREIRHGVSGTA